MNSSAFVALCVIACSLGTGLADMGSIPFKSGVRVFEPEQQALIAWSGSEEIMLLATQLRASEKSKVLEVMPLPSKPAVTKGEFRSLVLANNLIEWKSGRHPSNPDTGSQPFAAGGGMEQPAGRVVEQKRIGPHDIKITEVLDETGFSAWALDFLKQQGVPEPTIPDAFKSVIAEYLRDGFKWFVFDVVELGPELVKKDVLRFQFKTDRMYYPLRVTRAESGDTLVKLLILTRGPIDQDQFIGWPRAKIRMPIPPVSLSNGEVSAIDEPIGNLLGTQGRALLRTWEITGALDGFDKDLLLSRPLVKPKSSGVQAVP